MNLNPTQEFVFEDLGILKTTLFLKNLWSTLPLHVYNGVLLKNDPYTYTVNKMVGYPNETQPNLSIYGDRLL